MKDNTLLSEEEISLSKCPSKPHIAVKQRSLRKEAFVTGSTLFQASGLDSIKKRNSLFDKVHLLVPKKTPSSEVREVMAYGTVNEINAIATICTKILPEYFPSFYFVEVGIYRYPTFKSTHNHLSGKCAKGNKDEEVSLFSLDGVFVPATSNIDELLTTSRY